MTQITVPLTSASSMQTSLSVHSLVYTPALAHCSMDISSRPVDQLANYKGIWHAGALSKCYCTRPGFSELAKGIKSALNRF